MTHLPELFEFVDLLRWDLASSELLVLWGYFDEPGEELTILDERLPLARVPERTRDVVSLTLFPVKKIAKKTL